MDNQKKKITAAVSAVINYIHEEEAAIYMQSALAPAYEEIPAPEEIPVMAAQELEPASGMPAGIPPTAVPANLWGASGRQSQMQIRNLMQLRAFSRF